MTTSIDSPHVFVIHGDITSFACDAWLLPTDERVSITSGWRSSVADLDVRCRDSDLDRLRSGTDRAVELSGPDDDPVVVLTAVPLDGFAEPEELFPALRDFVIAAVAAIDRRATGARRRLLAVPAFGTGGGGGGRHIGRVLAALLREARRLSRAHVVDICFVVRTEASYALMQRIRRAEPASWKLSPAQRERVEAISALARSRQLVPFMGAGVSMSAGAPSWKQLIARLARNLELDRAQIDDLTSERRDALDQATWLRLRYERLGRSFHDAVSAEVDTQRYGLLPPMLAALGTEQAVTLNYDTLYERAVNDQEGRLRVIPGAAEGTSARWLLKLHGSVDVEDSIVLTRDDYLGFNSERSALSALVKATLMTRHLLFVGFGLRDDHFFEIAHDVRKALGRHDSDRPRDDRSKLGSVLALAEDHLVCDIWEDDFTFVSFDDGDAQADEARQARRLEVFMDAVLAWSTESYTYLLDQDFTSSLNDEELAASNVIRRIRDAASGDSDVARGIRNALHGFGVAGTSASRTGDSL